MLRHVIARAARAICHGDTHLQAPTACAASSVAGDARMNEAPPHTVDLHISARAGTIKQLSETIDAHGRAVSGEDPAYPLSPHVSHK